MQALIEYIARELVDDPTQVSVVAITTGVDVIVEVRVAPQDVGRLIGRHGRVINAIRALAQICAARHSQRASVEVIENE